MDCEKFLSISHCFFPVSSCKNRIMLSVQLGQFDRPWYDGAATHEPRAAARLK